MMDCNDANLIVAAITQIRRWLAECEDREDPTIAELRNALDVAWLAASRLRLECGALDLDDASAYAEEIS